MKGDYQLKDSEREIFSEKLDKILSVVRSMAIIKGPFQLQSAVRSYTKPEEKWTEYIYDIEITGDLGEFKSFCSFESDRNIDEQINNVVKNVAYEFWADKDKNFNSLLAEKIWGSRK